MIWPLVVTFEVDIIIHVMQMLSRIGSSLERAQTFGPQIGKLLSHGGQCSLHMQVLCSVAGQRAATCVAVVDAPINALISVDQHSRLVAIVGLSFTARQQGIESHTVTAKHHCRTGEVILGTWTMDNGMIHGTNDETAVSGMR